MFHKTIMDGGATTVIPLTNATSNAAHNFNRHVDGRPRL